MYDSSSFSLSFIRWNYFYTYLSISFNIPVSDRTSLNGNEKIILFSREIEKRGVKREQFETRTTIFPQLRSVPAFRVSIPFHSSVLKSRGERSCYQRTTPLFPSLRYSSSNNAAFQSPDLVHTFAYSRARVPRLATTRRGKIFWTLRKTIILAFTLRIEKFFHRITFIILPSFLPLFPFFFLFFFFKLTP